VNRWTGSAWVRTTRKDLTSAAKLIAIDSQDRVVLVTVDGRVVRGDSLADLAPPLGGRADGFALDSLDNPTVVSLSADNLIRVARWTGTAWDKSLDPLDAVGTNDTPAQYAEVTIGADDRPIVAWSELTDLATSTVKTFVRKLNR
jgi:hypothetical protein